MFTMTKARLNEIKGIEFWFLSFGYMLGYLLSPAILLFTVNSSPLLALTNIGVTFILLRFLIYIININSNSTKTRFYSTYYNQFKFMKFMTLNSSTGAFLFFEIPMIIITAILTYLLTDQTMLIPLASTLITIVTLFYINFRARTTTRTVKIAATLIEFLIMLSLYILASINMNSLFYLILAGVALITSVLLFFPTQFIDDVKKEKSFLLNFANDNPLSATIFNSRGVKQLIISTVILNLIQVVVLYSLKANYITDKFINAEAGQAILNVLRQIFQIIMILPLAFSINIAQSTSGTGKYKKKTPLFSPVKIRYMLYYGYDYRKLWLTISLNLMKISIFAFIFTGAINIILSTPYDANLNYSPMLIIAVTFIILILVTVILILYYCRINSKNPSWLMEATCFFLIPMIIYGGTYTFLSILLSFDINSHTDSLEEIKKFISIASNIFYIFSAIGVVYISVAIAVLIKRKANYNWDKFDNR